MFIEAARRYIEFTRHDQLVHREIAKAINGLTESLRMERKRVPGEILSEADRLECLFFSGFDPHFEGNEPPGLETEPFKAKRTGRCGVHTAPDR